MIPKRNYYCVRGQWRFFVCLGPLNPVYLVPLWNYIVHLNPRNRYTREKKWVRERTPHPSSGHVCNLSRYMMTIIKSTNISVVSLLKERLLYILYVTIQLGLFGQWKPSAKKQGKVGPKCKKAKGKLSCKRYGNTAANARLFPAKIREMKIKKMYCPKRNVNN